MVKHSWRQVQYAMKTNKEKHELLIAVPTLNRATELTILLQSLRTQTFQKWDIIIVDGTTTPDGINPQDIRLHYFVNNMINRLLMENHTIELQRQELRGLEECRQQCIRFANQQNYKYILFIDDDSVAEPNYVELLYTEATKRPNIGAIGGVVPAFGFPSLKRSTNNVKPIFNKTKFTKEGHPICANCDQLYEPLLGVSTACRNCKASYVDANAMYEYIESEVIETDHLQSGFLCSMKAINDKNVGAFMEDKSYPAFREDTETSMRIKMAGYDVLCHTGAIAYHQQTPSGGCRSDKDYGKWIILDDENWRIKCKRWVQKGKWKNIK